MQLKEVKTVSTVPFSKTSNKLLKQFQFEDHSMKLLCWQFPLIDNTQNKYLEQLQWDGQDRNLLLPERDNK